MIGWVGADKLASEYHKQKFMESAGKPVGPKDVIPYWVYDSLGKVVKIFGLKSENSGNWYKIYCKFDGEELNMGYKVGEDIIEAGKLREGDREEAVVESLCNIHMVNKLI